MSSNANVAIRLTVTFSPASSPDRFKVSDWQVMMGRENVFKHDWCVMWGHDDRAEDQGLRPLQLLRPHNYFPQTPRATGSGRTLWEDCNRPAQIAGWG
jgi:hypothetical protein